MKHKTTKKDFAKFKSECEKWIGYFGLKDWEVVIEHSNETDGTRGCCYWQEDGRTATICLEPTWNHKAEKNEVRKVAFHEVCELMLCRVRNRARISCSEDIVNENIHEIIRRLENSVFKEGK